MSAGLIIRPEAEADISEAAQWYEHRRAGLGLEFTATILEAAKHAAEFPFRHGLMRRRPQVRRVLVKRFPYLVFYLVRGDSVIVFAVLHQKRHESTWQERL